MRAPEDNRRRSPHLRAIRAWFMANPHEYLTYDDVCTRFGISMTQAYKLVQRLRDEGFLETAIMVSKVPGAKA